MAEAPMDLNILAGDENEDQQELHSRGSEAPNKSHQLSSVPACNSKEKLSSELASKEGRTKGAKSKRNLKDEFGEALAAGSGHSKKAKKTNMDQQSKASAQKTTATVTAPQSSNQEPKPSSSREVTSGSITNRKPTITQRRQLPDRRAKPKELDESSLWLKNLGNSQKERKAIEEQKTCRRKATSLKRLNSNKKTEKTNKTSATSTCFKTIYIPGSGEDFDESPDIVLRDDDSDLDWDEFLQDEVRWRRVHPIEVFPFAPLKDLFKEWAKIGLAVEVPNYFAQQDVNNNGDFPYWCGTIIHFTGYKAVVQLQDLGTLNPKKRKKYRVYLSLFCGKIKPLRWTDQSGVQLDHGPVVDRSVSSSTSLRGKLDSFYNTSPTITDAMMLQVQANEADRSSDFAKQPLATLCFNNSNEYRRLDFVKLTGNRLHAIYVNLIDAGSGEPLEFCSYYKHRNVVPRTLPVEIGAPLKGTQELSSKKALKKPSLNSVSEVPKVPAGLEIKVGMKLELLDVTQPYFFIVAKITKVYKHGYFEVETGGSDPRSNYRKIYHVTDPHVLPWGFAAKYGIIPLDDNKSLGENPALDLSLLPPRPRHPFHVGDKFEAVSLTASDFLGPVTVMEKAGHLVCVHFDGWTDHPMNYQWMDPLQDEIYPSGYCETFNVVWKGNVVMGV